MILYWSTTVLYLSMRRRLDRKEGAFDLGCFEIPVAIGALVWSAVVLLCCYRRRVPGTPC